MMMRVSWLIVLLGCVQYLSTEPDTKTVNIKSDTMAINSQETSKTQGKKLGLERELMLHRKGRNAFNNCDDCKDFFEDSGDDAVNFQCYEYGPCSKAGLKSNVFLILLALCSVQKY